LRYIGFIDEEAKKAINFCGMTGNFLRVKRRLAEFIFGRAIPPISANIPE